MSLPLPHPHVDSETLLFDRDLAVAALALCCVVLLLFMPWTVQLGLLLTVAMGWLVYQMASGDSAA